MKVSIVIATYNGWRFLDGCLAALRSSRLPPGWEAETIVVDNGSSDGTGKLLGRYPEVKAVIHRAALGFAGANNLARSVATGDVVVFLNNDTRVTPDWLVRPLQILERDPRVVGVGSKLLFMHQFVPVQVRLRGGGRVRVAVDAYGGPLDDKVRWSPGAGAAQVEQGVRGRWLESGAKVYLPLPVDGLDAAPAREPLLRLLSRTGKGPIVVQVGAGAPHELTGTPALVPVPLDASTAVRLVQNAGNYLTADGDSGDFGCGAEHHRGVLDSEEVVPSICGAALFARRTVLDEAGWFPSYYRVYYEDVDLCLRLRQGGGLLVYCPSSLVAHYHTGTNKEHSPGFVENVARSSLLFISQYGTPAQIAQRMLTRVGYSLAELGQGGSPLALWSKAHGTRGAIRALPGLGRVGLERSLASLRGRSRPADLLTLQRSPYGSP